MEKIEILEKIEHIFYENTFKKVSMNDIALILGIKKASLYYYFQSKEILINELVYFSFNKFKNFLEKNLENDLSIFVKKYLEFPDKNKNLFSIINQNGYCENDLINSNIMELNKEIFNIFYTNFSKKYYFSKEKTYIFMCFIDDINKKKCLFSECHFDYEKLINEFISMLNIKI